jgi:hypothetical protein
MPMKPASVLFALLITLVAIIVFVIGALEMLS